MRPVRTSQALSSSMPRPFFILGSLLWGSRDLSRVQWAVLKLRPGAAADKRAGGDSGAAPRQGPSPLLLGRRRCSLPVLEVSAADQGSDKEANGGATDGDAGAVVITSARVTASTERSRDRPVGEVARHAKGNRADHGSLEPVRPRGSICGPALDGHETGIAGRQGEPALGRRCAGPGDANRGDGWMHTA